MNGVRSLKSPGNFVVVSFSLPEGTSLSGNSVDWLGGVHVCTAGKDITQERVRAAFAGRQYGCLHGADYHSDLA
jgi:hypothetical protein